jgi:hypothetical protein
MSGASIKFLNLLEETKYAFLAGDYRKVELLLAEASVLVTYERRLVDEGMVS